MSSLWREPESRPVDGAGLPELIFELEWKKATKSSGKRGDIRASIGIWDPPDPTLDLLSFKSYLCQNLGLSGDVAVSYVDSDGDELPIDSECEFREALKFARARTKKYKNVLLMLDRIEKHELSDKIASKESSGTSNCGGLFVIPSKSLGTTLKTPKHSMAPIVMNIDMNRKIEENLKTNSFPQSSSSAEAIPPIWFKTYMETLKNDIVKEVSTKVMTDVMGVLNKTPCGFSCSHFVPRNRYSRGETNNEEKQQQQQVQHRKKKKRVVEELESSDALSPPQQPDIQLLRKVKKIEKREKNLRRKLDQKLERLEQMTRIIVDTKNRCHDVAAIAKNLNNGCNKVDETVIAASAPKPVQHGLITKEYDEPVSNVSISRAETSRPSRMNCSVTGNDEMMEKKTISKENLYESDSDSDNISIISGISNVSDLDEDYNFEMIQTPQCFILDKPLNLSLNNRESDNNSKDEITEKLDNSVPNTPEKQNFSVICAAESDRNNNRDSPSYEVLSGPASSASSIHLDEDHFHMSRNIISEIESSVNADLIDLNHDDPDSKKRNSQSALVVDCNGKIFEKNITDDETRNELIEEMYLDKRNGGAYAFVNETLPIRENETASKLSESEINVEQYTQDDSNLNLKMKTSHPSYEIEERISPEDNEIPTATQSRSNFDVQTDSASGITPESTQSFSSHTSHATGNNVYNFTQVSTRSSYTGPKYTVVDNKASKGLEETRYTNSFENNLGARGCQAKRQERNNETFGKYQRGFTSEDAGCVFTEQPQKSKNENAETRGSHSPEFTRANNDSVHILPETLVSGAVTLASSAYSTARKAFDRIRNMQTGEGPEHVENGITIGSDIEGYCALLEEMGFMNADLNARLLDQFNYDMSRVISELVQ